MKTRKLGLIVIICFILTSLIITNINAGVNEIQHSKTVKIKLNSMQCNICVENITKAINSVDGVVEANVNLKKKIATVTFDGDKTNKAEIEIAITSIGYDANNKKANQEAYSKLMECCKIK